MEREKSWLKITEIGKHIGKRWQALQKFGLPIEVSGIPALVNFNIPVDNWLKYKTLITQEMLKRVFSIKYTICLHRAHEPYNR